MRVLYCDNCSRKMVTKRRRENGGYDILTGQSKDRFLIDYYCPSWWCRRTNDQPRYGIREDTGLLIFWGGIRGA